MHTLGFYRALCTFMYYVLLGGQMAERLGSRAINQKVVGSIPGRGKLRCVLGHFTLIASGENVPVLTVSRSG